jgi:Fe-S-cluster containining protein
MSNFECNKCGNCCSNFLPLSEKEIRTMKKLSKKENKHPLLKDWYNRCPFLNNDNKCDIYKDRPAICQYYNCYNFNNHMYDREYIEIIKNNNYRMINVRKEIFGSDDDE